MGEEARWSPVWACGLRLSWVAQCKCQGSYNHFSLAQGKDRSRPYKVLGWSQYTRGCRGCSQLKGISHFLGNALLFITSSQSPLVSFSLDTKAFKSLGKLVSEWVNQLPVDPSPAVTFHHAHL